MSKVVKTILDPNYKVGYVEYSSEHDNPKYFTKEGKRIPFIETEVDYKPEYDAEASKIKHWFFKKEVVYYRDVYTEIGRFKARNNFDHLIKGVSLVAFDKYIGRFL